MERKKKLVDTLRASYEAAGFPASVLLGLSGGADSLALLFALLDLQQDEGFLLTCVHVNHHLRKESDDEAIWLAKLMDTLSLPLITKDVKVPPVGSLEAAARQVRYAAFHEALAQSGAKVLALAHHADDQAETMLMRLMHGTGPAGLAAMGEFTGGIWRPFLLTPKEELIHSLKVRGQQWLEDASNHDQRMLRNAIRHRISPEIEKLSPGAMVRMAQTAKLLRDEEEAWRFYEDRWLDQRASLCPPLVFLMTAPFIEEPIAFKRRLVRRLCGVYGINLDRQQTDALCACALPNQGKPVRMNLPGSAYALCTHNRLHVVPADQAGLSSLLDGRLEPVLDPDGLGDGKRVQTFDADKLAGAGLRQARRGDWIVPLGMEGSQSMAQYLSDRKIDLPFRRFWPVYAAGNQVLWAIGLGVSQTAAVTARTQNRIQYVFRGSLPGDLGRKTEEE